jgi:hypothetical protein
MKEKLMELLNQCKTRCSETPCDMCEYYDCPECDNEQIADLLIKNGVKIAVTEDLKCTASRNYEAEYHELLRKYSLLYEDHKAMETEFVRMRAQLDIVCLIFGGK